jgi:hypothetical protein
MNRRAPVIRLTSKCVLIEAIFVIVMTFVKSAPAEGAEA